MNGQTAKLLKRASSGDRWKYRQLKKAYTRAPINLRTEGKQKARELEELERQQKIVNKKLNEGT